MPRCSLPARWRSTMPRAVAGRHAVTTRMRSTLAAIGRPRPAGPGRASTDPRSSTASMIPSSAPSARTRTRSPTTTGPRRRRLRQTRTAPASSRTSNRRPRRADTRPVEVIRRGSARPAGRRACPAGAPLRTPIRSRRRAEFPQAVSAQVRRRLAARRRSVPTPGPLHAAESVRAGEPGSAESERRLTRTSWERGRPARIERRRSCCPFAGGTRAFPGRSTGTDARPRAGQREKAPIPTSSRGAPAGQAG